MNNINAEQINQAKLELENGKNILIALPVNPSIDKVASALSLYLSLSAAGKQASVVTPSEMTVQFNQLIGVDKISASFNSASGKNLIISFPYQEGSIEKVSYNIENDTFNLVIEPREGYPSITSEMMRYSFSGGNFDTVIVIGSSQLENLGQLYSNNQNLFNEKTVINIDNTANANFGKINLVDATQASLSELVLSLLDQMGLPIESDMATNLLIGITAETDNFSLQKVSASTFEAAAMLLKYGAKKAQTNNAPKPFSLPQFPKPEKKPDQVSQPKNFSQFNKPQQKPSFNRQPFMRSPQPGFKPRVQPAPTQYSNQQPQNARPQQNQQQPPPYEAGKSPETPPDWLKPKIYKGSTLL